MNKTLCLSVCVWLLIGAKTDGPTGKWVVLLDVEFCDREKWLKTKKNFQKLANIQN